jgi:hypothetical protein
MGIMALLLCTGPVASAEGGIPSPGGPESGKHRTVVVYSFHGTLRCTTCLRVEQGAEAAIKGNFGRDLVDGSLAWRSVNVRLPENQHFAAEYNVASWGLVLVEYLGERPRKWRNLSLAGELVRIDPATFHRYVSAEVRTFLDNTLDMEGEIKQ